MSLLQTAKAETNKRPACEPSASALGMFSSECGQYEHSCCSAIVKVSRPPPCHKVPSGACRQLSFHICARLLLAKHTQTHWKMLPRSVLEHFFVVFVGIGQCNHGIACFFLQQTGHCVGKLSFRHTNGAAQDSPRTKMRGSSRPKLSPGNRASGDK